MLFRVRYIILILIGILCITPLFFLAFLSFSNGWAFPRITPNHFTLENWKTLFLPGSRIVASFFTSLSIAITVSFLATFTGFITSRFISYHKMKRKLLLLAYFPFAISPVIFAACLRYYFIRSGLAGNVGGIIIAQLFIAFPYSVIFFTSFWNVRIQQFGILVNSLGGRDSYAFKKIIFPLAKPIIMVCFFQCFLISWFEYGLTNVIGFGKVQSLTITVFQFISEANIFQASLSCCILILPPVLLLWINKKFIFK